MIPDDKFGRNWRSVKIPNRTPEDPISVGRLYVVAESTLLFTDTSKNPTEVRWIPMDMSTNPPQPTAAVEVKCFITKMFAIFVTQV